MDESLSLWMADRRRAVDQLLDLRLSQPPTASDPGRLIEAMRYSLLAPGKRLRPLLAIAACESVGGAVDQQQLIAACSVELVHCYSLIHDDLPAMDDDDMRRGRPTNHKVFGEPMAILAGDALLTLAFEWLAEAGEQAGTPGPYLRAAKALALGAGQQGMVRGQARDISAKPDDLVQLEQLHREKTAALFGAALLIGGHVGGGDARQLKLLARFGESYGIAFQHADDLDDADHPQHAAEARRRLTELLIDAREAAGALGPRARHLSGLADALAAAAQSR